MAAVILVLGSGCTCPAGVDVEAIPEAVGVAEAIAPDLIPWRMRQAGDRLAALGGPEAPEDLLRSDGSVRNRDELETFQSYSAVDEALHAGEHEACPAREDRCALLLAALAAARHALAASLPMLYDTLPPEYP